jgi:hypothetical protein
MCIIFTYIYSHFHCFSILNVVDTCGFSWRPFRSALDVSRTILEVCLEFIIELPFVDAYDTSDTGRKPFIVKVFIQFSFFIFKSFL